MGQKVNPVGLRLGIVRGWDSNWYGGKNFADKLVEDEKIRKYVAARIPKGAISKVIIERTLKRITLTINTARPGVVIGKGGQEVDKIKEELKKITGKDVQINIFEIKRPEIDAKLIGETIAQQLEARISFRRAMKQAIASAMRVGAQGIKLKLSGRLGGAEMARSEGYKEGRIPLHTLRADIDYAVSEALTVYGKIGIKVWVCKGEVYGKRDLSPNAGMSAQQAGGDSRGGNHNRGGRDDDNGRRGRDNRGGRGGDQRRNNNNNNNRGGGKGGNTNNRGGGKR
ncbi:MULTISPECIES: 30S ribosomal protein S3 [Bacteroidota]|jgi:small subunit ribosomal protein S3|uniref:Small ribosomal subunit protein uS3 n=2 Tax=Flectobacillus TaxID=101 RepID=A0ABT6Z2C9_9BACT|nr:MULTISPECIES: 30S ribosomal protein S3 [Bacteroidota]NBA76067.1 30S ribosomal protein S3 [Emticicia sp. ODNR4P]MDI9861304.1 30S ribosomal protein S3 [Flectobacillus roseus]MDI9871471.1 30S ribosomal protein S3 [Flectobacillus roseus]MDI9875281.1 30S ribosomal protein S3 [Flectobacillus rivi]NBB27388.1 30S ribosomal protein S3 [Cellulophaga sp. BC115SP]